MAIVSAARLLRRCRARQPIVVVRNNHRRLWFSTVPGEGTASRQQPQSSSFGRKPFGVFHFGTTEYATCFERLPQPNPQDFRQAALEYLETQFDPQTWYDDPVCSIVQGQALPHTTVVDTRSALGAVNGKQVLASAEQLEQVIMPHIRQYQSPAKDLRDAVRQAEQDLLTNHGGALAGHQCLDFGKQDPCTELEEMVMCCTVERRLNDYLLFEERRGAITVNRQPIYVQCVSNFSNFLDLSRKVLRSLEVGIPVVILGRTPDTTAQQYAYRWTQMLIEHAVHQQNVDAGMITFVSCALPQLQDLLTKCQVGNLYLTGSRHLAQQIKRLYPNTIASTGGPNTMVLCTPKHANPKEDTNAPRFDMDTMEPILTDGGAAASENATTTTTAVQKAQNEEEEEEEEKAEEVWFTPELKLAIQQSATIESAGQCTALRHVVVPPTVTEEEIGSIFAANDSLVIESPVDALARQQFDGVFLHQATPSPPDDQGYTYEPTAGAYWKLNDALPSTEVPLPEYWRKPVLDFTKLETDPWDYTSIDKLAHWLNSTAGAPISLAVNGNMVDAYKTARRLFDRTSLVVYTVGGRHNEILPTDPLPKRLSPALSCQARPQNGEIFGELPPRREMSQYTKYPVYIPSSNPSYDATYTVDYLQKQEIRPVWNQSTVRLLQDVQSLTVRGYCCLLIDYLRNVDAVNPKSQPRTAMSPRTVLWGVQRPPLQTMTLLRVGENDDGDWDACAPIYLLFHVTLAKEQIRFSVAPQHAALLELLQKHKLPHVVQTQAELDQHVADDDARHEQSTLFQVVRPLSNLEEVNFPMVGQFTSLYFPMGHIKSTALHDDEFAMRLGTVSQKWLKTLF